MRSTTAQLLLSVIFSICFLFETNAQVGISFDGSDDCLVAANAGPLGSSNRTVECWIKTSSTVNTQQVLVNWGSMSPNGSRFTFNTIQNGRIRIELGGNGFNSNGRINDGNWHHVAIVYDHQATLKASLYIDGALDTARNFTVPTNTSSSIPITIGKRIDNVNFFDGEMDEIKIWDIALTTGQIRNSMFTSYCSTPSNLVAYYKLEEGTPNGINTSDTIAIDYSANTNDAILKNFSLQSVGLSNWVVGNAAVNHDLDTSLTQNNNILTANDSTADFYQWISCNSGLPIPGDTNRTFVGQVSGQYAVELTEGSCKDTSMCYVLIIQDIEEVKYNSDQFRVCPTLFRKSFHIYFDRPEIESTVRIFDVNGREIYNKVIHGEANKQIELNGKSGLYLVFIENERGESSFLKVFKR